MIIWSCLSQDTYLGNELEHSYLGYKACESSIFTTEKIRNKFGKIPAVTVI